MCGCLGTDPRPVPGLNVSVSNQNCGTPCVPPKVVTYGPAISAGGSHCLALCPNGTVVAWMTSSTDNFGQATVPPGLANVTAIAAGTFHSLALCENGSVVAWGQGWENSPQPSVQNATAISAGAGSCLALLENRTVVAWGCCHDLFVPVGCTDVVAISAGCEHNLALLTNGSVVAWGNNDSGACDVPAGLTNVTAIAAGSPVDKREHAVHRRNDWRVSTRYSGFSHCSDAGNRLGIWGRVFLNRRNTRNMVERVEGSGCSCCQRGVDEG